MRSHGHILTAIFWKLSNFLPKRYSFKQTRSDWSHRNLVFWIVLFFSFYQIVEEIRKSVNAQFFETIYTKLFFTTTGPCFCRCFKETWIITLGFCVSMFTSILFILKKTKEIQKFILVLCNWTVLSYLLKLHLDFWNDFQIWLKLDKLSCPVSISIRHQSP